MKRAKVFDAELVTTGNEILFGRLLDTNSAWITKQLTECGVNVRSITCIGDNIKDIKRVIQEGLKRNPDLIVTTGGLGPSFDDKTIEAVARAVGKKMILDGRALKMLQTRYKELSRDRGVSTKLSQRLKRMAFLIEGSEPLENPVGLAPGMKLKVEKTLIIALPGVPNEMKAIFKKYLISLIKKATGKRIVAKSLRVKVKRGVLASIIKEIFKAHPKIYLKTYAGDITPRLGIKIDILAEGETEEEGEKLLNIAIEDLKKLIGEKGGFLTLMD